jgi:hypothetical protein
MWIFIAGLGIFLLGAVVCSIGWSVHRKTVGGVPPKLLEWFIETLKHWFGLLTSADSTTGERIAAFGAILSGIGILTAVTGLGVWATG